MTHFYFTRRYQLLNWINIFLPGVSIYHDEFITMGKSKDQYEIISQRNTMQTIHLQFCTGGGWSNNLHLFTVYTKLKYGEMSEVNLLAFSNQIIRIKY